MESLLGVLASLDLKWKYMKRRMIRTYVLRRDYVLLTEEASDLQIRGNLVTVSKLKSLFIFALLGLLYGGVHASSWNGHFPTDMERYFWRVSVCIVGGGGF